MEKKNSDSYFKKHWRGELDLGISYWVNNILPSLLITLISWGLESLASNVTDMTYILIAFIFLYIFIFLIFAPWAYVGLWRSASNHIEKYNLFFWANVVRILVIIGVIRTVMLLINNAYPQSVGYFKLLTGTGDTPSYRIELENNNTRLKIVGGINLGLTNKVAEYMKQYPTIKDINLESVGGLTGEARGVAKIVQENNLDTYVYGNCLSSCTYIFVAGKKRTLSTHARLAFHRPAFVGVDDKEIEKLIVKDKQLFKEKGVNSVFIERIFSTPNSKILEVSNKELKEAGIVTDFVKVTNDFWKKSKKELALHLSYLGIKKNILEKDINVFMEFIYKDLQSSLPTKIDELTILDSVKIDKKSFKYEYLILERDKIENLKAFQVDMEKLLKMRSCHDLFSVYLLKNSVIIFHNYRDKIDNKLLASIEIKDCNDIATK